MDPTFVADWSKANGYRTANNGVDTRFFKAYAQNYGSTYGFRMQVVIPVFHLHWNMFAMAEQSVVVYRDTGLQL